jgi:hypothetical protein
MMQNEDIHVNNETNARSIEINVETLIQILKRSSKLNFTSNFFSQDPERIHQIKLDNWHESATKNYDRQR